MKVDNYDDDDDHDDKTIGNQIKINSIESSQIPAFKSLLNTKKLIKTNNECLDK